MVPEVEIVEDPYLGLRLQAWQVDQIRQQKIRRSLAIARLPPIAGGQVGVFVSLEGFLETLVRYLNPENWWAWLYQKVYVPLQGWIWEHVLTPIVKVWHQLQITLLGWWEGAITRITTTISNLAESIRGIIDSVSTALRNALGNALTAIKGRIEAIRLAIIAKITELAEKIRRGIDAVKEAITARIIALVEVIKAQAKALRERLSAIFTSLRQRLSEVMISIREALRQLFEKYVRPLMDRLRAIFDSLWNRLITAIRNWWQHFAPQMLDTARKVIRIARPAVMEWVGEFQKLPARFLEWVATTAGTDLALNPSRALATTGSLYSMSIAAGTAAMALATALNVIPGTNWVGAQQFSAFISEAAGFEPLTRATYGVLLQDALVWPLRYHWNRMLRPKIPTEGSIFSMGRKRGIDKGEFFEAMAYQGLPDWWIDVIYHFFWADPSPFWLSRICESGIPDWRPTPWWQAWADKWMPGWRDDPFKWVRAKLLLAGYEGTDVDSMIEGITRRLIAPAVTQVKTSVRAMLREGYWVEEEARACLSPWEVRPEEIRLMVVAEELDYQNKFLDEQVKLYMDAFRKEEIDAQDLRVALSTIIVKPERVHQIVAREQIRKLPKPKPPKAPKEDPTLAKIRSEVVKGHILMLRKRVIGARKLYQYLLADGLSEPLARATTIKELVSRIKTPPLDSPYFLSKSLQLLLKEEIVKNRDLFDKGEITVGQFLLALRAMGIDEDTATYLADVARLEKFLATLPAV